MHTEIEILVVKMSGMALASVSRYVQITYDC